MKIINLQISYNLNFQKRNLKINSYLFWNKTEKFRILFNKFLLKYSKGLKWTLNYDDSNPNNKMKMINGDSRGKVT